MTILDTLKSLLGLESEERRSDAGQSVGVTVEREPGETPDASSERAVKGTVEPESEEAPGAEEAEPAEADEAEEATPPAEADDGETVEATGTGVGTDESPDVLDGIGPAYADRLAGAGVDTVRDLVAADAASLAEEIDVSESRLEGWIEQARNR